MLSKFLVVLLECLVVVYVAVLLVVVDFCLNMCGLVILGMCLNLVVSVLMMVNMFLYVNFLWMIEAALVAVVAVEVVVVVALW